MSSQVYVSHLAFCQEPHCSLVTGKHLLITKTYVDLARGNALAISYTWGEYGRRKVVIGHEPSQSGGRLQEMELGLEWTSDGNSLAAALDSLCCEGQYCWIDQLSIDQQSTAQIRKTLSKIPDIYRSLDVVVLCPSKMCACQMEQLPSEIVKNNRQNESLDLAKETWRTSCINNIGFGSWFSRLWTRQEFIYAHRIRWHWLSPGVLECPEIQYFTHRQMPPVLVDAAFDLSSYRWWDSNTLSTLTKLRLDEWAVRLGPGPHPPEFMDQAMKELVHDLKREAREILLAASYTVHEWAQLHRGLAKVYDSGHAEPGQHLHDLFQSQVELRGSGQGVFRLLQGHCLEGLHDRPVYHENSTLGALMFKKQLGRLSESHRAATKPCDYVLAVWIDCPGYEIPVDFKSMSLSDLLTDALAQLHRKHDCSVATSLPAGIFGIDEHSALWCPAFFADTLVAPKSCEDVYGIVLNPQPHFPTATIGSDLFVPYVPADNPVVAAITDATLGKSFHPHVWDCSRVCDYDAMFGNGDGADALAVLLESARSWSFELWRYLSNAITRPSRWESYLGPDGRSLTSAVLERVRKKIFIESYPNAMKIAQIIFANAGTSARPDDDVPPEWPYDLPRRHAEGVYQLVCQALKIDHAIARKLGLRVMVDRGRTDIEAGSGRSPPRFGLTWIDLGFGSELETSTIRACSSMEDLVMMDNRSQEGNSAEIQKFAYEAIEAGVLETGEYPGTQYRIIGAWVPNGGFPDELVEGFVFALKGVPTLI
ncbi:MAG: hypothetical protein Q9162_005889 [Coniocarpon cinnabarinum]